MSVIQSYCIVYNKHWPGEFKVYKIFQCVMKLIPIMITEDIQNLHSYQYMSDAHVFICIYMYIHLYFLNQITLLKSLMKQWKMYRVK